MGTPRTVLGLTKKVIEWYDSHYWTTGSFYRPVGKGKNGYCVLGAATACVTNDQLLKDLHRLGHTIGETDEIPSVVDEENSFNERELPEPKALDLVYDFEGAFDDFLEDEYDYHEGVICFNDSKVRSKKQLLEALDEFRRSLQRQRRKRT